MKKWLIVLAGLLVFPFAFVSAEELPDKIYQAFLNATNGQKSSELKGLIIIKFYSAKCPPCQALNDALQEESLPQKWSKQGVRFYEIDYRLDQRKPDNVSSLWNISAVPSLLFFQNGEEIARSVGFSTGKKEEILQNIQQVVAKHAQ